MKALSPLLDWVRPRAKRAAVPIARAYMRYLPLHAGKRAAWDTLIGPRLSWVPHRFVVATSFGSSIAGDTADRIQRYIYYFGVWEPHLTRWLTRRLSPGDVFVDVGANIGYYSLLASSLVGPRGGVVAIEASPSIFAALRANLARNRVDNVRAVPLAVSDREGTVSIYRAPEDNIGMTTTVKEGSEGFVHEGDVPARPLPAILTEEEIARARVIKIDVEGAEATVARGMWPLLSACRRELEVVMEVSPERLAQQGQRAEELFALFSAAGFHAYRLENDYSSSSYVPPCAERRPQRLRSPVTDQTDVIFSQEDSETL